MPTAGEYRARLRRRRIAAALLLAPVAGYGVVTGAQAARNRLRDSGSDEAEDDVAAALTDPPPAPDDVATEGGSTVADA